MILVYALLGQLEGTTEPGSETDGERSESASLSTDEVFHILQTKRRRDVLRYLRREPGPVEMRELAEQVAAWEQGSSVAELSSSERQRVYISLYQSHLPKLDEEGIVDYDKDRGMVERTPAAAQFDPYLGESVARDDDAGGDPWPVRYAFAVVLGALVLVAAALEAVPLSGVFAGLFSLGLVAVLVGVHARAT